MARPALLARHLPDAVAVESAFYGKNVRTTVVLSHARGRHPPRGGAGRRRDRGVLAGPGQEDGGRPWGGAQAAGGRTWWRSCSGSGRRPEPADAADGVAVALAHLLIGARQAAFFGQVTGAR